MSNFKLSPGWGERIEEYKLLDSVRVLIADPTDEDVAAMKEFINNSKLNLITVEGVDVSDHSLVTDVLYEYIFGSEQDALLFRLRWKK